MLIAGVVKAVIERVTVTDPMQQRRDETVLYCGRSSPTYPDMRAKLVKSHAVQRRRPREVVESLSCAL